MQSAKVSERCREKEGFARGGKIEGTRNGELERPRFEFMEKTKWWDGGGGLDIEGWRGEGWRVGSAILAILFVIGSVRCRYLGLAIPCGSIPIWFR